jgi:MFS family permease
MAIALGITNGLFALAAATIVLFAQEVLELDAASFGLLMTSGAAGGLLGSLLASRLSRRIGQGPSLFSSIIASTATLLVIGITSSGLVVWIAFAVGTFFGSVWNVITVSLRQALIPDRILGRVNSVYRFFGWGMMPIGAVLGGVIVAVAEPLLGREWALRAPFLFAFVVHAGLYFYALPRLNSERIDAARRLSKGQVSGEESSGRESS